MDFLYFGKFRTILDSFCFSGKGQTWILSDGLDENLKHSGKLWSCSTCIDKNGHMQGLSNKTDFLKKHCKEKCSLFMEKPLNEKDKHGWGKNLDQARLPGPYGRPKNHFWEGKESGEKQLTKPVAIQQERRYF